jgi:DnaJ-domain-containing protein 1
LRRRHRDGDNVDLLDDEQESVQINGAEHAWWAERDELETGQVPHGRKRRTPPPPPGPKRSAFEAYYSSESLFDWSGDAVGVLDETDPYVVLGVPVSATWDEIISAHRRLAKLHHPDRLVDATDEQRESGNERIRELNIAYMELRRRKGK